MLDIDLVPDQGTLDDLYDACDKAYIYTKRSPAEFCNTVLYFIIKGSIALTPRGDKTKVRTSLLLMSRIAPDAPLAAILVNKLGKKGYYGTQMQAQQEKFIKKRESWVTYIPSRWIAALKVIEPATKYKAGAPKAPSVRRSGKFDGGGALAAKEGEDPKGYITAAIDKLRTVEGAGRILNEGMNKSIQHETGVQLEWAAEKMWAENLALLFH